MTATLPTLTPDAHVVATADSTVEAIALDWLIAKDVENAAKDAEKIRKAAGELLALMLGDGGTVTVNKGGFRTYRLGVTNVKGRVSADRAVLAMIEDGIISQEQAAQYLESSRGAESERIALKPVKS